MKITKEVLKDHGLNAGNIDMTEAEKKYNEGYFIRAIEIIRAEGIEEIKKYKSVYINKNIKEKMVNVISAKAQPKLSQERANNIYYYQGVIDRLRKEVK